VTVADLSKPGLFASASSWYYTSIKDEIAQLNQGNPTVVLTDVPAEHFPNDRNAIESRHVRAALTTMKAGSELLLTRAASSAQLDFDQIREEAVHPRAAN
jgi:hypothetical protein